MPEQLRCLSIVARRYLGCLLAWSCVHHELPKDGVEADAGQEHQEVVETLFEAGLKADHGVYHGHEEQGLQSQSQTSQ